MLVHKLLQWARDDNIPVIDATLDEEGSIELYYFGCYSPMENVQLGNDAFQFAFIQFQPDFLQASI